MEIDQFTALLRDGIITPCSEQKSLGSYNYGKTVHSFSFDRLKNQLDFSKEAGTDGMVRYYGNLCLHIWELPAAGIQVANGGQSSSVQVLAMEMTSPSGREVFRLEVEMSAGYAQWLKNGNAPKVFRSNLRRRDIGSMRLFLGEMPSPVRADNTASQGSWKSQFKTSVARQAEAQKQVISSLRPSDRSR